MFLILTNINFKKLLDFHWKHLMTVQHLSKHCTPYQKDNAISDQDYHITYKIVLEKSQMFYKVSQCPHLPNPTFEN